MRVATEPRSRTAAKTTVPIPRRLKAADQPSDVVYDGRRPPVHPRTGFITPHSRIDVRGVVFAPGDAEHEVTLRLVEHSRNHLPVGMCRFLSQVAVNARASDPTNNAEAIAHSRAPLPRSGSMPKNSSIHSRVVSVNIARTAAITASATSTQNRMRALLTIGPLTCDTWRSTLGNVTRTLRVCFGYDNFVTVTLHVRREASAAAAPLHSFTAL